MEFGKEKEVRPKKMSKHDAFISYATEDSDLATKVAQGLQSNGLSVWFAPLSLKVGDKLLDSIEGGLTTSRSGVLIISKDYLEKGWTSQEMDILIRQHVESNKKILPIWHGVTKKDVENRHISLSGIVAITETDNIARVVSKLIEALSDGARSRGVIPDWERPAYRFLQGLGEVTLQTNDGPATTIYELLIHGKDEDFPFWLGGKSYTKKDLVCHVAQVIGQDPSGIKRWVGKEGYKKLWQMCIDHDLHPNNLY